MTYTNTKWGIVSLLAVPMLLVSACANSESESAGGDASDAECEPGAWPDEDTEITAVVNSGTGGSQDRQARLVAELLQDELEVPVLVENRPGAGGVTGVESHLNGDPADGTYFVYDYSPSFEGNLLSDRTDWSLDDFSFLGTGQTDQQIVTVSSESSIETIEDLKQAIESDPGSITYGMIPESWSDFGVDIILNTLVDEEAASEVRAVPYDSGTDHYGSLLSGDSDFIVGTGESILGVLPEEEVRFLAVVAGEPAEMVPDVPLLNEELNSIGIDDQVPVMTNNRFMHVNQDFEAEYPCRWQTLTEGLEAVFAQDGFQDRAADIGFPTTMGWVGPAETEELIHENVEDLESILGE